MRLRALITIDIDATDFVEAAEHQRRLEEIAQRIKSEYEHVALLLRERRERAECARDLPVRPAVAARYPKRGP